MLFVVVWVPYLYLTYSLASHDSYTLLSNRREILCIDRQFYSTVFSFKFVAFFAVVEVRVTAAKRGRAVSLRDNKTATNWDASTVDPSVYVNRFSLNYFSRGL